MSDASGRSVELTEERWEHICERHPEISEFEASVLRAVEEPDRQRPGRIGGEEWYHLKTDAPSSWLKVVVAYGEGRGHIVTAHARRSMP
ncbi:MAG: hypothetical protein ACYCUM_09240 [Solirubrobacteraceae bacterium]